MPTPVAPPEPVCEASETCFEIQNTDCVAYTGEPLDYLSVSTNDRLTSILQKMDDAFSLVGTGVVYLKGSKQIEVVGSGSAADPYYIRPILAVMPNNLLRNTRLGMVALLDEDAVAQMLQLIKSKPELKTLFCSICGERDLACQILTLTLAGASQLDPTRPGYVTQRVRWTAPAVTNTEGDYLKVMVKYRRKNATSSTFNNQVSVDKTVTEHICDELLLNTFYQLKLVNNCSPTVTSSSDIVEMIHLTRVGEITKSKALNGEPKISFAHLGGDIDKYTLLVSGGALTSPLKIVKSAPAPGLPVTHEFEPGQLQPNQSYELNVIVHAEDSYLSASHGSLTSSGTGTPVPETGCKPPTGVTAQIQ